MSVELLGGADFKGKITNMSGWSNVKAVKFCDEAFPSSNTIDLSKTQNGSIKGWIDGTTLKVSGKGQIITTSSTKWMFDYCSKLTSIDLGNLDTTNVGDASFMFENCSSLVTLDLSTLVTDNWDWAGYIFTGCTSLTTVDLRNWNLKKAVDVDYLFQNCSSLETIYVNDAWTNTSTITKASHVFTGCSNLPGWSSSKVSGEYCKLIEDGGYFIKPSEITGRTIAESVRKLKVALDDSKVALTEKEVTPPVGLKFSGIAAQIDKIGE